MEYLHVTFFFSSEIYDNCQCYGIYAESGTATTTTAADAAEATEQ